MEQLKAFSNRRLEGVLLISAALVAGLIGIAITRVNQDRDIFIVVALLLGGVLLPILVMLAYSKPAFLWWGAIVCLAFWTSEPINPQVRAGLAENPDFNLFGRYVADMISTWDVLIVVLLVFVFFRSGLQNRNADLVRRVWANSSVRFYAGLLLTAILVGCVVILISQSHVFVFRDWVRGVMPIFYFLSAYFLAVNLIRMLGDFRRTWWLLQTVAFLMVLYGLYRLQGILSGQIKTLWPFGIPIVLYSELIVFYPPILVYFLTLWTRGRLNLLQWFLLLAMIVYILVSTRRFNYINLALYSGIAFVLGYKTGLFSVRRALVRSWSLLVMALGAGIVSLQLVPDLLPAVMQSIETILFFTGKGFEYTGQFRLGEISGIFSNLTHLPFTWLTGYGVGSKWRVFTDLSWGSDPTGGNMAFDAKIMANYAGWLPFFHVPYFATLFRFGLLGTLGLIAVVWSLLRGYGRMIRTVADKGDKIILIALLALIPDPILFLGDSPVPSRYIWLAIYLGLLESYRLTRVSPSKILRVST